MKAERALSSVVLPLPVPPEITMLIRALTQAERNSTISRVIALCAIRSSTRSGLAPNRRIESRVPSRASGGMIALTRLPSASRASTIGLVSSTRRPTRPTIRWMIWTRCRVVVEGDVDRLEPALALDVDVLGPLTRISVMVGSRIRGSSGPRPNVSSSTSLTSRSRSLRLSRSDLWRLSSSAARRTSSAQLVLVHRADRREVHPGDELLVQLPLDREEPLLVRKREACVSIAIGL